MAGADSSPARAGRRVRTDRDKTPSPLQQRWQALPEETRKQLTVGGLVLVYLLIIGVGGWYNFNVYTQQSADKHLIEGYERELARASQVRADTRTEEARAGELQGRSDAVYARLPDVGAVPVIVGQLEQIARDVGGSVEGIEYVAPFWVEDRGRVPMRIVFAGSFDAIETYMQSVSVSVPSLAWDTFEIQPVDAGGRELHLVAEMHLDVLRDRPDTAAAWADDQVRLAEATPAVSPFATTAVTATRPLPPVALHGVVQQNGQAVALLSIDGVSHVLRAGQAADGVTLIQISNESVLVGNGERTARIGLTE